MSRSARFLLLPLPLLACAALWACDRGSKVEASKDTPDAPADAKSTTDEPPGESAPKTKPESPSDPQADPPADPESGPEPSTLTLAKCEPTAQPLPVKERGPVPVELPAKPADIPEYDLDFVGEAGEPDCNDGPDCRVKGLAEWDKLSRTSRDEPTRQRAYMMFRSSCQQGDGRGCLEQARLMGSMFSVPTDQRDANEAAVRVLYNRSCDLGYGGGCYTFGMGLEKPGGRGEVDFEAAKPWLERSTALHKWACDAGELRDCVQLAYNYNSGRGAEHDPSKAAELYRVACAVDPDDGYSCDQYAQLLHGRELGEPDVQAAHEAWAIGCACEPYHGCASIANDYREGNVVAQDDETAIAWLRRGCPKEGRTDGGACFILKQMCDEGKKDAC